eukprot:CAMPEP_0204529074 /NCGR_PEP_ID=MMETSP0661-20131031/9862_1 /ASSEMBLY_ACC=CAM_ASM_000606 /TAXON_ID=109239 /ORGANISM="Alexandrium margalefi, Strain AMGDE01CS-322" /LENGTH=537 /DNA_ID=CAMNT_0051535081 /DNA_START=78 /DNA_END=1691 /DNA_ORIENTATION=+
MPSFVQAAWLCVTTQTGLAVRLHNLHNLQPGPGDGGLLEEYKVTHEQTHTHTHTSGQAIRGSTGFALNPPTCWDDELWGDSPWALTQQMCRRSPRYIGKAERMDRVLSMLNAGHCISMVAMGTSITDGHCLGCPGGMLPNTTEAVWPNQFRRWLNFNFPCSGRDGHKVERLTRSNSGSDYWAFRIFDLKNKSGLGLWKADLIVVETANNDVMNSQKTSYDGERDARIRYFTELVVRQLLAAPKRPALIWLTAGWRHWETNSAPPHHHDATYAHLPVLEYYDIPQVSMLHAFLPFNGERLEWLKNHYFADSCCHPSALGHKMCAQILGSTLMEDSAFLDRTRDTKQRHAWFTTEPDAVELPQAMFSADATTHRLDTSSAETLDLTDPHRMDGHVQARSGFEFMEDVRGKPGLIAMDVGSEVTIGVAFIPQGGSAELQVGMLKSYAGMGVVRVSYAAAPTAGNKCGSPSGIDNGLEFKSAGEIDASWSLRVSIHDFTTLKLDLKGLSMTEACLWLNFRVVLASPPRDHNKIKLLDILLA